MQGNAGPASPAGSAAPRGVTGSHREPGAGGEPTHPMCKPPLTEKSAPVA